MNIGSISSEIGSALHPGAKKKQLDAAAREKVGAAANSSNSNQTPALRGVDAAQNGNSPPVAPVVNGLGLGLKFFVDKETGTRIISVIDLESGEVVRQIPSEEAIAFLRHFQDRKGTLLSIKL